MTNSDEVGTMQFQKLLDKRREKPKKDARKTVGGGNAISSENNKEMEVVEFEDKKFRFLIQIELHRQH